jgi:hypothetical protein
VRAHRVRAGGDGQVEDPARAGGDIVGGETPLGGAGEPDGLGGRLCRPGDALGQ